MGKTVIVSSHILPELADVCNKIGIIDRGVMNVNAAVADVMKQIRRNIELTIQVAEKQDAAAKLIESLDGVDSVSAGEDGIVVTMKEEVTDFSHLASELVSSGHKLQAFRENVLDLESAFMALTKGMGSADEDEEKERRGK